MSEENRLRVHAQIRPDAEEAAAEPRPAVRWRSRPHPLARRPFARRPAAEKRPKEKLSFGDRLLRNSAFACALLLAILAVGNIDQPWARRASETVRQALTMRIDLDESIGGLSFVKELMPESALVFLNLTADTELSPPSAGELAHAYSEAQPWLLFACGWGDSVTAVADGTVTAVSELGDGETLGLLVDHGNGLESVYAYLSESSVESGQRVERGQTLGASSANLYFELRESGAAVDPTERMGL